MAGTIPTTNLTGRINPGPERTTKSITVRKNDYDTAHNGEAREAIPTSRKRHKRNGINQLKTCVRTGPLRLKDRTNIK
jgi:hypothetical protein